MPGMPLPQPDERGALLAFLRQQRYQLSLTAHGLTDEEARATPARSTLSVGGLIKYCAYTERGWIDMIAARESPRPTREEEFVLGEDESLAGTLALLRLVETETEVVVRGLTDLGATIPAGYPAPWDPPGVTEWPIRFILLHLIEEIARHTGHADIVRESLDGAGAGEIMAAVENWPANDWIKPWTKDVATPEG